MMSFDVVWYGEVWWISVVAWKIRNEKDTRGETQNIVHDNPLWHVRRAAHPTLWVSRGTKIKCLKGLGIARQVSKEEGRDVVGVAYTSSSSTLRCMPARGEDINCGSNKARSSSGRCQNPTPQAMSHSFKIDSIVSAVYPDWLPQEVDSIEALQPPSELPFLAADSPTTINFDRKLLGGQQFRISAIM